MQIVQSVSQAVDQHKHAVDSAIAGTGFGAAIVSLMDVVQPAVAFALAVASLILVGLRIWIAIREIRNGKDKP